MRYIVLLLSLLIFTVENISAQSDTKTHENPFSYEASFVGDGFSNFRGGIKRGTGFLGLTNIQFLFETEKARLWKGGSFHVNFSNTFGNEPSTYLVGDIHGFDNIEAGNHTFLQELWFSQQLGKINFTLGLQDMNVDFAASKYGASFINSSFGIHSTFSSNVSSPIFPLTSLGLTILWQIDSTLYWKNALYDGEPSDFATNPFNLNWSLSGRDGVFVVSEFQKDIVLNNKLPGHYRLGAFVHEHNTTDTLTAQTYNETKYGFYLVADQRIALFKNGHNLGVFTQLSYCPQRNSDNFLYLGCGISMHGVGSRKHDHTGLAVAYARFRNKATSETAVEAFYLCKLNENMHIQPDLQYIINPSGTDMKLKNALVGTLRFTLQF